MHYYQFRIAEWMLSTAHLTLEEEGVYRRLVDHYYDTESPFPKETQSVIRRLRLKGYEGTVADILEEFFTLDGDVWRHDRCDKEIKEYQERAEQARKNGKNGGRPPKKPKGKQEDTPHKNPPETASVSPGNPGESGSKANQEPVTSNQKPLKKNTPKNKFSDADMETAEYFLDSLLEKQPDLKKPNLDKWADIIRLMREQDERKPNDILDVWRFARSDPFWQQNILSADSLRKQYDRLKAKMGAPNATDQSNRNQPGLDPNDTSWADELYGQNLGGPSSEYPDPAIEGDFSRVDNDDENAGTGSGSASTVVAWPDRRRN